MSRLEASAKSRQIRLIHCDDFTITALCEQADEQLFRVLRYNPISTRFIVFYHLSAEHHTSPVNTIHHQWTPYITSEHHTSPVNTIHHQWTPYLTSEHHTSPVNTIHHQWTPYLTSEHHTSPVNTIPHQWTPHITSEHHTSPVNTIPHQWTPYITSSRVHNYELRSLQQSNSKTAQ